jgi:superkiller protein 3
MIRIAKKARKTGNPEAAISFYNKALELDPSNAEAYLGLAESYIDTNLLDAALEYIKKAERNDCDPNRSFYLRGKIMLLSGDIKGAEKQFLKSNSIDAMNVLGAIYDERDDHKKAQSMYKQVIAADPNYIDAYNNMGLSLLLCEKYKESIFYLENACSLPEANVTYRSNLALAYGLSGDIAKARTVYAQDFEGEELEEKVAYVEDLLASKQNKKDI